MAVSGLNKITQKRIKIRYITESKKSLTDQILEQERYDLIWLNASNNPRIKTVRYMNKLKKLDATGNCGINDEGIQKCINLNFLYANYNPKIKYVNHSIENLN